MKLKKKEKVAQAPVVDRVADIVNKDKTMVIMVGMQGAGKSFFTKELKDKLAGSRVETVIVCQDIEKTKPKVIKATRTAMNSGTNVVVDRTNPKLDDRKLFIDMAKEFGYKTVIVWLKTPEETCKYLNMYRTTEQEREPVPTIAYNLYKGAIKKTPPTADEADYLFEHITDVPAEILEKYQFKQ